MHNVVYVATEHNSVYAFDADGLSSTPLWKKSFLATVSQPSHRDVGECCDIARNRITGTPVIDRATGTLYVVAKTKETAGGTTFVQRLHALDIGSGAEKFGGPVVLSADIPGTGGGSSAGRLQFNAQRENQRPALLLNNGVVYISFSSHGDVQPYHGWILGYDASTLQQTFAYCPTANGVGAGLWLSSGPAADTIGNVFIVTGNGTFDADGGGTNFGDSYVKITSAGAVTDYFTPHDQGKLDVAIIDLGSVAFCSCQIRPLAATLTSWSAPGRTERSILSIATTWAITIPTTTVRLCRHWQTSSRLERQSLGTTAHPCTSTADCFSVLSPMPSRRSR